MYMVLHTISSWIDGKLNNFLLVIDKHFQSITCYVFLSVEYAKKENINPLAITDAFAGYISKK